MVSKWGKLLKEAYHIYAFDWMLLAEYDGYGVCLREYIYIGAKMVAECIWRHNLCMAFLAYDEVGLGDVFMAWLWLDALPAIVHAKVTVRDPYIGDVPSAPIPWNPWSPNPIYLA